MSQEIIITSVTANTPVDIYYCDSTSGSCIYQATVSTFPYTFYVSAPYTNGNILIKIVDTQGCEYGEFVLITPTPTPTLTATPTVTPSVSPTNTPTNTSTPTVTPTITESPTETPTNTPTPTTTPVVSAHFVGQEIFSTSGGSCSDTITINQYYTYISQANLVPVQDAVVYQTNSSGELFNPYNGGSQWILMTFGYDNYSVQINEYGSILDFAVCEAPIQPTPSETPTETPTTTPTSSITPTVTTTSTVTPTNTSTPNVTSTPTNTSTPTPTSTPTLFYYNVTQLDCNCNVVTASLNIVTDINVNANGTYYCNTTDSYLYRINGSVVTASYFITGLFSNNAVCSSLSCYPCPTPTPSVTPTFATTPTNTPTTTSTPTNTGTLGATPSQTPTNTTTPTITPTNTSTPTSTPVLSPSVTPTNTTTPTETPTNTPTNTTTPTNTGTPGASPSQTPTITPTNTETPTNTQTPTNTETPTQTPSETPTNTPTTTITPTNTETPTQTPTNTTTPTNTPTNTPTPTTAAFSGYLFPEPQDSTSLNDLGQYLFDIGATWFGYGNEGIPSTTNYSTNMDTYAHYSGWTGFSGNFITPVTSLSGAIRQLSGIGTDSYGCSQNQYTFGTIQATTSQVNPNIQYYYTVWIPLAGVGGTMTNMTIDVGDSTACSTSIIDNGIPDATLAGTNVTVTSGAAIPAGTYRILWLFVIPVTTPLPSSLYFKGDTKS
jgi:hypothetical protein